MGAVGEVRMNDGLVVGTCVGERSREWRGHVGVVVT